MTLYSFIAPRWQPLKAVSRCVFVEAQAEARGPKIPRVLSFLSLLSQMSPDTFGGVQLHARPQ